jgi:bromodomain adjacent to zinc finger domain protein 1A
MDEDYDNENDDSSSHAEHKSNSKSTNKIKLNGNHLNKNGRSATNHNNTEDDDEDDIIIGSSDEDSSDRKKSSTRKRKLTSDNKQSNNSSSKENKKQQTLKTQGKRNLKENEAVDEEDIEKFAKVTRAFRNRNKKSYNESGGGGAFTDEDTSGKSSPNKRIKTITTVTTPEKAILNDSLLNNNTNSRNTEMVHRLKVVEKHLNEMMKSQDGWPFLKPVSRRDAPDYFEVIEKPMDFSTIKNKLNNFKYSDYTNVIEDIRLVFSNCHTYNEPGSDIYKTGMRLSRQFEANAKQAGLLDYITDKS